MNMNDIVGRDDLLLMTFDTLRYDAAQEAWRAGETPNLAALLPAEGWEQRHAPGNFTFASHAAFFAGFLPTPVTPGKHARLFAMRFPGSETATADTCVFDADNLVAGLAQRGYHTICIGGVGFFNKLTPLGSLFPAMFAESHWSEALGVSDRDSTANQIRLAVTCLGQLASNRRVFLFINLSAMHQPNYFYLPGATHDNLASHRAALRYIDAELPALFQALQRRGSGFGVLCSDHGTAYGEDGYHGHRVSHPVVWNVPYAEIRWRHQG